MFKSIVTTNQSSPISLGSISKRIFDQACLGKKLDFQTVFLLFWKCIFKIYFFQASQGVVKSFCYYKSKFPYINGIQGKKNFWPSLLRKKKIFKWFFCCFANGLFKIYFFKLVKESLKSIATTNQSSPMSLGSKSKEFSTELALEKIKIFKWFFVVLQKFFLKYIFFKPVKEVLKSFVTTNQSCSPISMGSMSKRVFDLACLGKKLDFQTVFSLFWKCIFKINFFQASQGVVQIYCYYKSKFPYVTGIQVKNNFWPSLLWKKLRFSNGFFVVLQIFFWNIFFSSQWRSC